MRILFVTSEVAGVYKLGGLADVSRSLPLALGKLGVSVDIAMPFYKEIRLAKTACIGSLAVHFDGGQELVFVFAYRLAPRVRLLLFRHQRTDAYFAPSIVSTFAFFSKAVTYWVRSMGLSSKLYDVVHCQDWHTALVPMLLGESAKTKKRSETVNAQSVHTILTIHNILYQGISKNGMAQKLGMPSSLFHPVTRFGKRVVNFLREGVEYADEITTVSPTYAKEIMTRTFGERLEDILRRRKKNLVGILNGIDGDVWNPAADQLIAARFTRAGVTAGKWRNKQALEREVELPVARVPLLGFIGRMEPRQKGIGILLSALTRLDGIPLQVVIQGIGNAEQVRDVAAFVKKYKHRLAFVHAFDEKRARLLYAGADLMVIPSKFEPCGLVQMIAMRYGTIPLVRKTGGLADTLDDGRTGFVFGAYTATALAKCLKRATTIYYEQPSAWKRMQRSAMSQDFSWTRSALRYKALYQKFFSNSLSTGNRKA